MNDTQLDFKFEAGNDKKYKVDSIRDSVVYAKKLAGQIQRLYYLVLWKGYPQEKNTWVSTLAIQHFRRLVTAYHKDNPEKSTVTSAPVNTIPLMARPSALPRPTPITDIQIKRKRGRLAKSIITITIK